MDCDGGGEQTGYGGEIAELQCGEKEPAETWGGVSQAEGTACAKLLG